ncbi:hypothetical protein KC726_02690 [Candidatus Woesebacteria bacterium]|nr:hypothetical protein [Candidatus Woesebacteria bacterium]
MKKILRAGLLNKLFSILLILVVIGIIGYFFYQNSVRSRADNPTVGVQIEPAEGIDFTTNGPEKETYIYLNSGENKISGATIILQYPNTLVDYSDISLENCDEMNGENTNTFLNTNENGRLVFTVLFQRPEEELPSGSLFCLAKLFFKPGANLGSDLIKLAPEDDPEWEIVGPGPDGSAIQFTPQRQFPNFISMRINKPIEYKHRVFVSSTKHKGNFGSLIQANNYCQNLANNAGLEGTYKAWLSTGQKNAVDNIRPSIDTGYITKDSGGTKHTIAENLSDLIDGDLKDRIQYDENGDIVIDGVWTGTNQDGTWSGNDCNNWKGAFISDQAMSGKSNYSSRIWTEYQNQICDQSFHVYCFNTEFSPDITITPTQSPTPTAGQPPPTKTPTPTNAGPTPTKTPGPTKTPTPSGPTISPQPTQQITPPQDEHVAVTYKLHLQGISKTPKRTSEVAVQITLLDDQNNTIETRTENFIFQDNGVWTASVDYTSLDLAGQTVSILLKPGFHLQRHICDNTPRENLPGSYQCSTPAIILNAGGNTIDTSGVEMLAGDLPPQDGLINSQDLVYVRNNLGSTSPEVIAKADVNFDGIVDAQDYGLILYALGFKFDEGF